MQNRRDRLKNLTALLLLVGIGVLFSGCDTSESSVEVYSVQYSVLTETLGEDGSALLNRVFFDDESGTQTLEFDPQEQSFNTFVELVPGDTIYLRAEGTMATGRMILQIAVGGDDGSQFVRSNFNMPYSDGELWIEIPREALP
jgi:hypothetical protein